MSDQKPRRDPRVSPGVGGWGLWTGIVAIAAVLIAGVFVLGPGSDESKKAPSSKVEGTSPAPNVTPNPR